MAVEDEPGLIRALSHKLDWLQNEFGFRLDQCASFPSNYTASRPTSSVKVSDYPKANEVLIVNGKLSNRFRDLVISLLIGIWDF